MFIFLFWIRLKNCLLHSNLSTMATLGTEQSGCSVVDPGEGHPSLISRPNGAVKTFFWRPPPPPPIISRSGYTIAVVERFEQESKYKLSSGTTKSGNCRDLGVAVCGGVTVTLNDAF